MRLHLYHDETPPEYEYCPECGCRLNFLGECPHARDHEDPTESYRDEGTVWCP